MDSGLKKRLLGAIVLIALAVIFVPMLLPSHPGSQSASLNVPPVPSGEMQTRVLQVGPNGARAGSSTQAAISDPDHLATVNLEGHPAPALQPLSSGPPIEATTEPQTSAPAASPVTSTPSQPVAEPPASTIAKTAPPASAHPEPVAGGAGAAATALYTVNLGVYANHASADKLAAKARKNGFTALATPETYQGKSVTRVRVGPFHSRSEAEAARLKLQDFEHVSMTVEGSAVNQKGDAPASAIATNQPGGWAVQLAAFSDEVSANKLRDRLRSQGFDGFVDSVNTSKGKLWRVRAGPFASRDVASAKRGQIAQKLKITGDVVTE